MNVIVKSNIFIRNLAMTVQINRRINERMGEKFRKELINAEKKKDKLLNRKNI